VVSLVNAHLVGNDRLELSELCKVMLTSWRTLKDICCQKL
jgi:predicted ATP-grasp superfamily ATP-dependent carboligase